ncbi:uncharacterized protein [Ptychodera flava]|uniref:uncharacterized protein n=1 Tax=Ptychodera flava TaxID=63121 RepID=UPI00396A4E29
MLREILVAVVFTVAVLGLHITSAVTLDDKNEITENQVLQIPKYWPTDELLEVGSSSLLSDNREEEKRNGFWNGKRNGFWNGKRNGFWNGKRSFDEKKRNGFYNGKRSGKVPPVGEKRTALWDAKRNPMPTETENAFLNLLSSKLPENEQKCTPCGPDGKGQCVMYGVCCDLKNGCYMLTKEADACVTSQPTGFCGGSDVECGNGGKCVADGVCCDSTDSTCFVHQDCDIVWY